ncbi:response regulator transcription factor [filamentous cyanobacterium LEGE 07170]|nr:response regulator transcription factor [filamentous cyanobacterium LEGE 07170]
MPSTISSQYSTHQSPFLLLSEREQEVLSLMVEGHNNSEIARQLYVSPNTIKTHVRGILNKLGVKNRIQAAILAVRYGLV